ncbi:MAG: RNA polymerase sigma factor [Planctomycetota bacterium]
MNQLPDRELIQLIREDPEQGFTVLLRQYGGRVRGDLCRRFPSLEEGELEDAVTDAMLRLGETFDGDRGALPAWFLLLAHQQAIRLLRGRNSDHVTALSREDLEGVAASDDPLASLETVERLQEVHQAVASLPGLERAVLEADLAAGRGAAAEGLAKQLGTTEASVYAARRRGRRKVIGRCRWVQDWLRSGKSDETGSE